MAAYSGASQIIFPRECWHPGNKTLPDGVVGRTPNSEMRPSWNSVINNQLVTCWSELAELEKKYDMPQVKIWRHTLNKSANLAGIKSLDFRNDVELLEEMINLVLARLSKHLVNRKRLIGIDRPIAHLESLLQKESNKVRVIGIWGMGGIGKTTIAEEIFNQNHSKYDGCFFATVSEDLGRHRITSLKEKLFSTLLGEDVKIGIPNGLSNYIEKRVGGMKVLIILDDVSDTNQLERLFGTLDWIRSDSRIIVTTRDRQILISNRVDHILEVGILNSGDALELFNLNAFNQSHLEMEYSELSKMVVHYAKGVPLVLKVLGHFLCGKDKEVWKSQLDKLKKMPIKKVHDILRLSYDDLDRVEQKIFLDIACFFNGLNLCVDRIKVLLKDWESDNAVVVGLERLKDKALITISEDYVVRMHDIIQEMGREIVRQESSEDPGSRSRLWDPDDICEVFNNDKGTEAIRSIKADLSAIRKLKLSPRVFAKMSKLKFLDFHDKYGEDDLSLGYSDLFPQGLQSLPNGLRYVHWKYYPLKSFPKNFSAENLVMLQLIYSRVETLWCGVQNLVNLKEVNLMGSELLRALPDLSKASNLEVLDLRFCCNLMTVHQSIFSLGKLEELNLRGCNCLTFIPKDIHLSYLRYLNFAYCGNLRFSVVSENTIAPDEWQWLIRVNALPSYKSKLEVLVLIGFSFESLPSWIKNQTILRVLDLRYCEELQALPELPSSLETLLVDGCISLKTVWFPSSVVEQFKLNMKRVEFWGCLNLDERSLSNIALIVQINLMKYTHQHLSGTEHDYVEYFDDYYFEDNYPTNQAVYAYPGSSVPEWFDYKTTKDDMIIDLSIAQLSPPLGFIFCFILSMGHGFRDRIKLSVTIIDGEGNVEKEDIFVYTNRSCYFVHTEHVCIIYDLPCSCYLSSRVKHQTRFKIKATRSEDIDIFLEGQGLELKGFGVSIVNPLTYLNFTQQV